MHVVTASALAALQGIAHGFFSREGGVSSGLYESLNCGLGSRDARDNVIRNRALVTAQLGVAPDCLLTLYQIHSPVIVRVNENWSGQGPQADGMVTRKHGLALGILTADCTPILFADPKAGVIGACHAGWKGALAGVAQATIAAMIAEGAERTHIVAAIGPTIRQRAYEVGAEFRARFLDADGANAAWFRQGITPDKFLFDLPGYLKGHLQAAGITTTDDVQVCTYGDDRYFSYRRTTHRGEADYGRNISAIALT
jgi:YfiH family protein